MKLPKKIPRAVTGFIIGTVLLLVIVGVLGFVHAFSTGTHCFSTFASAQFPKWVGCAMGAHENLAGGLIGLGGALFAAWLAYSGAQDQLRKLNQDARETSRLRAVERRDQAGADLNALKLAREYLADFVGNFPPETAGDYKQFDFAEKLRQLDQGAHVYLSRSGSSAPSGFGRSITKAMWRMEKLAENINVQKAAGVQNIGALSNEIRLTIEEVRKIMSDLDALFPNLEQQLKNLNDQVENLTLR
jgi:methyl-accepting chemotaxis protein